MSQRSASVMSCRQGPTDSGPKRIIVKYFSAPNSSPFSNFLYTFYRATESRAPSCLQYIDQIRSRLGGTAGLTCCFLRREGGKLWISAADVMEICWSKKWPNACTFQNTHGLSMLWCCWLDSRNSIQFVNKSLISAIPQMVFYRNF